jgi:hypothetical protein
MLRVQGLKSDSPCYHELRAHLITLLEFGRLGPSEGQRLAPTCSLFRFVVQTQQVNFGTENMCGLVFEQRDRTIAVPRIVFDLITQS